MNANPALPLITGYAPDAPLLRGATGVSSQAQFLGAAAALAAALPQSRHAINLCEDRGAFLHAFAAALLRGQITLLPPGRAPGIVAGIARAYPGSYLLCDGDFEDLGVPQHRIAAVAAPAWGGPVPEISAQQVAAIVFTSGSTGGPQPHPKSWRNLVATAGLCADRFLGAGAVRARGVNIVATVPPQHMYSLELSIMMALAGGCSTHAARPFFPADLRAVLETVPAPRMLVTTPAHLRSLVSAGVAFPKLDYLVSATAPLSSELAREGERVFGCVVQEIYGCTEAGSMCTRRTLDGERWQPYPGLRMVHNDGITHVSGPHLDAPVSTPDLVETHADGSLTLLGRSADMVKVAGKRASLAELTGKLLGIPGVEDGVVFLPAASDGHETRPAAVVVAPAMSEKQILDALARQMDPVFLPRPLRKVDKLPRNALGKLPRAELLALLRP